MMMMRSAPWGAAAVSWAATAAATFTDTQVRLFACALGGALVSSLVAAQSAFVTARLDRGYAAMAAAFIRQQPPGPADDERQELAVVRARDRGAP